MATYKKSVTVWSKASFEAIPASALAEIDAKKAEMQEAGTMHEQEGYTDGTDTVTILYRFTTQAAAEEWATFIDGIATANDLNKISSRIVSVEHVD